MTIFPEYLLSLEQRMQLIQETEYAAMTANLWAPKIFRTRPSNSRKELLQWFLSTARIEDEDEGGNVEFDEIEATYTTVENKTAGRGLKLKLEQLEDLDGGGAQMASQWVRDISQVAAYWPQLQTAKLMIGGTSAALYPSYDGLAFFSASHWVNPVEKGNLLVPSGGSTTYRNLHTSSNALPIDNSVSVEVALENIGKLVSYLASIPTSNGQYPRHLQPIAWFVPPALGPRASILTGSKFIAAAAGSSGTSGGSLDVQSLLGYLNMGMPEVCPELGAAFGGSDTTYYVLAAPMGTARSVLGPVIYIPREPFGIVYHGPQTTATLAVKREFQWVETGRYGIGPGHPFELHRVQAA
jgi:hypothetical protein